MKFKLFNVFALLVNIIASVACIIAIAIMFVYDGLQCFATLSFYVSILTFVTAFIGMQYNVKRINANHCLTPTWYMILRLLTISTLIVNTLLSLAFTEGGAWSLSYFIIRLALPILMLLGYVFFDIDRKVPFYGVLLAPIYCLVYYAIFLPIFATGTLEPPYQYLDVNHNSWTITFLMIICVIACSILIACGAKGLNQLVHMKFYKKIELNPQLVEEFIPDEIIAEKPTFEEEPIEEINKDETRDFEDQDTLVFDDEPIESTPEKIEKFEPKPKRKKKVNAKVNTSEKIAEKVEQKVEGTSSSETKTTRSKKITTTTKKTSRKSDTKSTPKVDTTTSKISTTTKNIKKVDTSTKQNKKIAGKNSEEEPKIDTSTRVISRLEINELIGMAKKPVNDEEKIYHVSHHKTENKWQVKLAGGGRALKLFKTQLQAINYAKELVKTKGGSIRIHSVNGQIRKG